MFEQMFGGMGGGGMGGQPRGGGRGGGRRGGGGRQGGDGFYGGDKNVISLNIDNWEDHITGKDAWIIEFYAPWCGHCRRLEPEWKKAAKQLRGEVKVGAINCDAEEELCHEYGVQGYPTILYFPFKNPDEPEKYSGGRTAPEMVKFARSKTNLPSYVSVLASRQAFGKFLGKHSSRPKLFIITNKAMPTATHKSLSREYFQKIDFAIIHSNQQELVSKFQVDSLPTLVIRTRDRDTDERTLHYFSGKFSKHNIQVFLKQFAVWYDRHSSPAEIKQARRAAASVTRSVSALLPFPELNADSFETLPKKGHCVILFIDSQKLKAARKNGKTSKSDTAQALANIAEKYKHDPLNFFWVDNSSKSAGALGKMVGAPKTQHVNDVVIAAIKVKRMRSAHSVWKYADRKHTELKEGVESFLDRILGGTERFNSI
jgi:protein disulfide-isomerase A6